MYPKKAITLSALVIVVFFFYYSANAAPLIDDGNYTYISGLRWYNTYDAGLEVAKAEDKPMLVYFWALWCTFCEKLHKEVYPDPRVSKILKEDFVLVAVDLDTNREDTNKFGAQYPPKLLFLDSNGERIINIPGYVPTDTFLPILEQISATSIPSMEAPHDLPRTEDRGGT